MVFIDRDMTKHFRSSVDAVSCALDGYPIKSNEIRKNVIRIAREIGPILVATGDSIGFAGYAAIKRMLSIPDPPNAIVRINDNTAFGR